MLLMMLDSVQRPDEKNYTEYTVLQAPQPLQNKNGLCDSFFFWNTAIVELVKS